MSISQECVSSLEAFVGLIWELVKTNQLQPLIWLIIGTKLLTRILCRTGLPEANLLAAALTASLFSVMVIVATESPVTTKMTAQLRQCTAEETRVASVRHGRNE